MTHRLSSLDLLLLALVKDGIATPYELRVRAGVSLGSTVPALARLQELGMVKPSNVTARKSRIFTLTEKGAKALRTGWKELLRTTPTDLDAILRICYLAWVHGSAQAAFDFLDRSALRLRGLAAVSAAEVLRFGSNQSTMHNERLLWLRARLQAARLEAEAKELATLAQGFEPAAGRQRGRKKSRPTGPE